MTIFTKGVPGLAKVPDLSDFSPSLTEVFSAQAAAGYESSLGWAQTILNNPFVTQGGQLSKDLASKYVTDAGFPKIQIPEEGMDRTKLDLMIERQRRLRQYGAIANAGAGGSGVVGLAGSFFGSAGDPLNVLLGLVPVPFMGPALASRLATQTSFAARAASRLGVGAAEGMIGAAIAEPFTYSALRELGDDYKMTDSLMNIAVGGMFSGVLRAGAGGISDVLTPPSGKGLAGQTPTGQAPQPTTPTTPMIVNTQSITPVPVVDQTAVAAADALAAPVLDRIKQEVGSIKISGMVDENTLHPMLQGNAGLRGILADVLDDYTLSRMAGLPDDKQTFISGAFEPNNTRSIDTLPKEILDDLFKAAEARVESRKAKIPAKATVPDNALDINEVLKNGIPDDSNFIKNIIEAEANRKRVAELYTLSSIVKNPEDRAIIVVDKIAEELGEGQKINGMIDENTLHPFLEENREAVRLLYKHLDNYTLQYVQNKSLEGISVVNKAEFNPQNRNISTINPELLDELVVWLGAREEAKLKQTAAEKVIELTPEERRNAFALALYQMQTKGEIDIQPYLDYAEGKIDMPTLIDKLDTKKFEEASTMYAEAIENAQEAKVNAVFEAATPEALDTQIKVLEEQVRIEATLADINAKALGGGVVDIDISDAKYGKAALIKMAEDLVEGKERAIVLNFFETMPDKYFEDTGIQFKEGFTAQGQFNFVNKVITIFSQAFREGKIGHTILHEVWHSLDKYVDETSIRRLKSMYERERNAFEAKNPGHKMDTFETYRFNSFTEWFADTLTDRAMLEAMPPSAEKTFFQKMRDFISRVIESMKQVLGYDEVGRVLKKFKRGEFDSERPKNLFDEISEYNITAATAKSALDTINLELNATTDMLRSTVAMAAEGKTLTDIELALNQNKALAPYSQLVQSFIAELNIKYTDLLQQTQLQGAQHFDLVKIAVEAVAERVKFASKVKKRASLMSFFKQLNAYRYVDKATNKREAMFSLLSGSYGTERGRFSVESLQRGYMHKNAGAFIQDLRRLEVLEVFQGRQFDREIARALYDLNSGLPINKYSDVVRNIATVVAKHQNNLRIELNKRGAWIQKLHGRITRQSHDIYKVRGLFTRDNRDAWVDFILPKLNLIQTFQTTDVAAARKLLEQMYGRIADGYHVKTAELGPALYQSGMSNQLDAHRELIFKDADAFMDYNDAYGTGDLFTAIFGEITKGSEKQGLMEVLGPDHNTAFENLYAVLRQNMIRQSDFEGVKSLGSINRYTNTLGVLDGSASVPGNMMGARLSANLRSIQSLAKLGGMVISQLTDVALAASELRYQGVGFFDRYYAPIAEVLNIPNHKDRVKVAEQIGIVTQSLLGDLVQRFDDPSLGGMLSRGMSTFMKYNGTTYVTDALRRGVAFATARDFAQNASVAFKNLQPEKLRLFKKYGLTAADWNIMRKSTENVGGVGEMVTPEAIAKISPRVADKYRALLLDRTYIAVLEPDARTRSAMTSGTKKGTWGGELVRFVTQFKTFAYALFAQQYRRDWVQSDYSGLVQSFVGMTALGFIAYNAKQITRNREPLNPVDQPVKAFMASALQGGALGLWGDFLFGQVNRFGGGILETAAGPVLGTAATTAEVLMRARDGDVKAAEFYNLAVNNTPFINLFYTRWVLNYLILDRVQEELNPGYFRRVEAKLQKEEGRGFIIRPY